MDLEVVKRINLLELLEETRPEVPPPPEDAAETWTEEQIHRYYDATGPQSIRSEQRGDNEGNAQIYTFPEPSSGSTSDAAFRRVDVTGTANGQRNETATGHKPLASAPLQPQANSSSCSTASANCSRSAAYHAQRHTNSSANSLPRLEDDDPKQPGGGRTQIEVPELDPQNAPPMLRHNQLTATVAGYRAAAVAHGIPFRPHGLFPPRDPLLAELAALPGSNPFEKHMAGESSSYQYLPQGGWTTGDAACRAGFDLRMFYQERQPGAERGMLLAAARLGEAASIGAGCWVSAHGGAVESLLDEATAELAKMEWAPTLSTIEAVFKIKKAVPLNTTLRIACEITEIKGVRCWVLGTICDTAGKVVFATCEAQLVDLAQLWAN